MSTSSTYKSARKHWRPWCGPGRLTPHDNKHQRTFAKAVQRAPSANGAELLACSVRYHEAA